MFLWDDAKYNLEDMPDFQLVTRSPEETQSVARLLGERCVGGEIFLLVGPLGAGKTCFTQGLAWGLGVEEYTHSPTFVMVAQYRGRLALHHIDLYRVESTEEAIDLGLDEYLYGDGVCAIEWAEKLTPALAEEGLLVEMEHLGEDERRLTFRPSGRRSRELLAGLQDPLARRAR